MSEQLLRECQQYIREQMSVNDVATQWGVDLIVKIDAALASSPSQPHVWIVESKLHVDGAKWLSEGTAYLAEEGAHRAMVKALNKAQHRQQFRISKYFRVAAPALGEGER